MKGTLLEKGTIAVLFVLVLVVFSFADRDSKKLAELYNAKSSTVTVSKGAAFKELAASQATIIHASLAHN